jgi:hypothetical protein
LFPNDFCNLCRRLVEGLNDGRKGRPRGRRDHRQYSVGAIFIDCPTKNRTAEFGSNDRTWTNASSRKWLLALGERAATGPPLPPPAEQDAAKMAMRAT